MASPSFDTTLGAARWFATTHWSETGPMNRDVEQASFRPEEITIVHILSNTGGAVTPGGSPSENSRDN